MWRKWSGIFITRLVLLSWLAAGTAGCVHVPPPASPAQVAALKSQLVALGDGVAETEAGLVAAVAYDHPRELARQYRLVRPALWHNLLVNLHLKSRGLCYQWAEDLGARLETLQLRTLELRWGVARPETLREHNTVVVTAREQPFAAGLVLDPWRSSGTLVWSSVTNDSYPWREGVWTVPPASQR